MVKYWPFSLPPMPDTSRRLHNMPIDWAYDIYKHVILVNDHLCSKLYWDTTELEDWCMHNLCYYIMDRAWYDPWMKKWYSNSIGGGDEIFIVTKVDSTATMAALLWG